MALTRCSGAPSSHLPQPLSRLFEQLQQKCPTVLGLHRNCVSEAIYLHSLQVSSISPIGIKHWIPVDAQGQGCSSRSTRDETRSYGPRNKAEHKHPSSIALGFEARHQQSEEWERNKGTRAPCCAWTTILTTFLAASNDVVASKHEKISHDHKNGQENTAAVGQSRPARLKLIVLRKRGLEARNGLQHCLPRPQQLRSARSRY